MLARRANDDQSPLSVAIRCVPIAPPLSYGFSSPVPTTTTKLEYCGALAHAVELVKEGRVLEHARSVKLYK